MNIFRRKGFKIVTLAMAAQPTGFSLMALVETAEAEVEHLYNFLRRTEDVRHVTYYRQDPSGEPSFVFIDADTDSSSVTEILKLFPESKLILASHGKYLLELPAESCPRLGAQGLEKVGFLPLARVKSTQDVPSRDLVRALAP